MPSAAAVRLQVLKSQTQCPSCGARVQVRCLAYRHRCPDLRGPRKKRTARELTEEEVAARAEQLALKASGTFLRRIAARAPSTDAPADGAPADGVPADGAPADGVPADGAPANGAPADGAGAPQRQAES